MKKIGILTFHRCLNIGALLQAYALTEYLNKIEPGKCEAELIDYINHHFKDIRLCNHNNGGRFRKTIRFLKYYFPTQKRRKSFDCFIEKTKISKDKYSEKNIYKANNHYELFIVGSDQVFNPIPSQNDTNFVLSFVDDDSKKYSYAASFGVKDVADIKNEAFLENIKFFNTISIREKDGKEMFDKFCPGKATRIDVDPTFLLSKKEWSDLIPNKTTSTPYIFVYFIFNDFHSLANIIDFAKDKKIAVFSNVFIKTDYDNFHFINLDPTTFLQYTKNATYIFTNSFHGTALSIIFEKQFLVLSFSSEYSKKISSRITNLLSTLGLEERCSSNDKLSNVLNPIEYKTVIKKEKSLINNSKEYLEKLVKEKCL